MNHQRLANSTAHSAGKMALKLLLLVSVVTALNFAGQWLADYLNFQVWPHNPEYMDRIVLVLMIVFFIFMTLPFFPAIEIGLLLLALVSVKGVIVIYCLTILALSLAFEVGRYIPLNALVRLLNFFHLTKASRIIAGMAEVERRDRLDTLREALGSDKSRFWVNHRYLLVAVLLNMPGNSVIGGGGGIALLCGMSGIHSYGRFLLTTMLAALPIPALVIAQKLMLVPFQFY
ncbi:hypothetical protein BTA51_09715 [Hahella sp. CCB-MM4]|uniref:hypothetical protein n=1 Tax=Hahella sp. (strain CCB-MM4) TaxID=1926491 RepID=UPI000B9B75B8|nr:hypothetical protein [Hahella sp. CCB-MM4]OZG74039.1 hypothetical protein BTA51_09715 [Hahella sp. CCB-MM4]